MAKHPSDDERVRRARLARCIGDELSPNDTRIGEAAAGIILGKDGAMTPLATVAASLGALVDRCVLHPLDHPATVGACHAIHRLTAGRGPEAQATFLFRCLEHARALQGDAHPGDWPAQRTALIARITGRDDEGAR